MVECRSEDLPKLEDTIFAHFQRINALEFKGVHDPLDTVDFNRIMMRAWGIGVVDNNINDDSETGTKVSTTDSTHLTTREIAEMPRQRTVTIVCVTKPIKILKTLQRRASLDAIHFEPTDEAGIYWNGNRDLPTWIIHPSELALIPKNYSLLSPLRQALAFSPRRKVETVY